MCNSNCNTFITLLVEVHSKIDVWTFCYYIKIGFKLVVCSRLNSVWLKLGICLEIQCNHVMSLKVIHSLVPVLFFHCNIILGGK